MGGPQEFITLYPASLLKPIKDKLLLPEVMDPTKWADGRLKWADNAQQ